MQEVKAAHERLEKMRMLRSLEVAHSAKPAELQAKLMAELSPAPVESPFARLMARALAQQAARAAAQ